MPRSRAQLNK
jgi:ATP-dependent DNA helicase 2 subunit 1